MISFCHFTINGRRCVQPVIKEGQAQAVLPDGNCKATDVFNAQTFRKNKPPAGPGKKPNLAGDLYEGIFLKETF
jgi:hypothetical protein